MSSVTASQSHSQPETRIATSSLAESLVLLAGLTVIQRLVGIVRGVLFCRWMTPAELGQWDLSFGFLMLAGPLLVLGIPGSFGRYVEHYLKNDQLRVFLTRTVSVTAVLTIFGCLGFWYFDNAAAMLLFKDAAATPMVHLLALVLVAVIVFHFLIELFTGMRQMRVVSAMQFINSLAFAVFGLGLIVFWQPSAAAVAAAYGLACAVTSVIGGAVLISTWKKLPQTTVVQESKAFWSKLLPFAAWVWVINLLANLFEIVDRYMIVHFGGFTSLEAVTQVGNYHSSRVLPWLMVSVAGLFGGMLMPHLSADWEAGKRKLVALQMNTILKIVALIFTLGGISIALVAPLLFTYVFDGKYDGGLAVLPWTLTYSIWFSLTGFIFLYIYCAEKAKLGTIVFGAGLIANVSLNLILLPVWGLQGAVMATAVANVVALIIALVIAQQLGMQVQRSVWLLIVVPVLIGINLPLAIVAWSLLAWQAYRSKSIFNNEEKQQLKQGIEPYLNKVYARLGWNS